MLLKSSIITSDTKEKSLQYLSNKSYNSSGYIKHKLVVTAFNTGIKKTSKLFKVSKNTLKNWGKKINQNIDITKVLPGRGRKSILNNTTHKEFLGDTLKENPNLTLRELIIKLKEKYNIDINKSSLHQYLKNNLKLSYITPRPKHYKQDPIKQDEFKEEINENIKKNDYDLVLFMDESRFGTHSNTGHGWFPCGKRTTVEISIGYENFYVYSAVSSTNGYNFNLIMPNVDSECMNSFLKELSLDNTGKKILLIADGASLHDSKTLEIPENIYIAKLPPYSPELNPTERFFQYMKEQIIKNKLWTTISELKNNTMSFLKDITNEQVASICACNYIIK